MPAPLPAPPHHGSREPLRRDRANMAGAGRPKARKSNPSQGLRGQARPGILDASVYHEPAAARGGFNVEQTVASYV